MQNIISHFVWALWDEHFPRRPQRVMRRYLEARLAYRLQEIALGGLSSEVWAHLASCGKRHSKIKTERGPEIRMMPGTTLIREWDRHEYRVTVLPDGLYKLNGQRYKSLSAAARAITGTHCSGPAFSGGNTDRPALKRLMADIEARKVDIVVVYKIDRLTRSLTDFSRLIEVFERRKVSFVSVTQQFNTTTSMGRLMLNVLLSFAQFEREVTGERIRDKIAASKAKGMWMGGQVPLGYRVEQRQLIVDDAEAALVKRIFLDFVQCRSTTDMVRQFAAEGKTNKTGKPFSKQMLYQLLHNRLYLGEIAHKGKWYPGQHAAIIDEPLWGAAQAVLAQNNRQRASETWQRRQPEALLLGLFYAQDGERFQPAFTRKPNGKRYRYYVPIRKVRFGADASRAGRVPAEPIEQMVLAQVHAALQAPEVVQSVWDVVREKYPELTEPEVVLSLRQMGLVWEQLFPAERQRIVQLLIERVTLRDEGIEIVWRDAGWADLAAEMRPGTIGAELLDLEQEEAVA